MSSPSGGKKSKRKRAQAIIKGLFQSPSASGSNVQLPGTISTSTSTIPSPSLSQLNIQPPETLLSSSSVTNLSHPEGDVGIGSRVNEDDAPTSSPASQLPAVPSASSSNVKEGLGVASRFVQTLLKKLPDCVDSNPVKMALSIVKTIIVIKDEIGDNKDSLTDGLRSTQRLLSDAIGKVDFQDSDSVREEMEDYNKKIEEQNSRLLQIAQELETMFRHVDYENYKKRINNICKDINEITDVFMFRMQVEIRTKTALMHDRMEEEKKERLRRSLQDLNPSMKADHRTVLEGQNLKREICTEGTRVKILEDITNWANDPATNSPHVFWLTGQAGSGKTTIAYTIAKRFENGQSTKLGSNFLCSRQFDETRRVNRILPTIAYQLAYKCEPYEEALHAHVGNKSSVVNHDISDQIQELISVPWIKCRHSHNSPIYLVVIDALDEVSDEDGTKFLGILLTTINQQKLIGLKFLVTSRTDPRIVNLCESFSSKAVCRLQDVPIEDAETDVRKYLDAKLPNLVAMPELGELNRRASGLFIYAATAVRILTKPTSITKKEQSRRLNHLISTTSGLSAGSKDKSAIDELYEQIMYEAFSEFPEDDMAPRLRILYSYICAAERVSPSVAAILMDDDDEVATSVSESLHAVLYIQDNRVFWYHASFPDFILTQSRSNYCMSGRNFEFWCDEATQHHLLATACLRIMTSETYGLRFNMGDITSSYLLDSEHADELSENISKSITPVLRYSSFYWARHLSSTPVDQNVDNMCIFMSMSKFLEIRVLFWLEAMHLLGSSDQCTLMLRLAREWVLNSKCIADTELALARDLLESANFATYFAGSPAAESTPHLYISSLATWREESTLSLNWKSQFLCTPVFDHASAGNDVPLLVIRVSKSRVRAIALSKSGAWIVSGSEDGYVQVWDASTGKEVKTLKGHVDCVNSVAFSNNDKWIVSGSDDCTARIWEVSTGKCLSLMEGHTYCVNSVAFSSNGLRLVSGSGDESICMWDSLSGGIVKIIHGHTHSVTSAALSSDGVWIVSGSYDQSIRFWDTSTGEELRVMRGHTGIIRSVAISHDNAWVVSGSADCSMRLWDVATGGELKVMEGHTNEVLSVAFSGNGAWIVSGSLDSSVRVWSTSTGEVLKTLKGHTSRVNSVASSSDATRVISGSNDGSVRVWNVSPGIAFDESKGTTSSVRSVAFSSNGKRILFGCDDGSVHVRDTATGWELITLRECTEPITSIACSNDGSYIAWGSGNEVWVWDLGRNIEVQVLVGHTGNVNSIVFSGQNGGLIASGSDDCTVRLWDALKGVELQESSSHTDRVQSVAFSGDGKMILSSADDKSMRIWDVESPKASRVIKIKANRNILSVAFSSDSMRFVSGSDDGTVQVWDTQTRAVLRVLRGHTQSVRSVAISSDGVHVVSGSTDGTMRVWNASEGKEIMDLRGRHADYIFSIAISSDSRSIVSGSRDGSVILWDMEYPAWYNGEANWILSYPSNDRLMWAPPDTCVLRQSNGRVIAGVHIYSSIDFENAMTGPTWSQCYTPTHPAH